MDTRPIVGIDEMCSLCGQYARASVGAYCQACAADLAREQECPARPGRFSIDDFAHVHAGYTLGETWNGFAVPYFERDEAIAIMGEINGQVAADLAMGHPDADDLARLYFVAGDDSFYIHEPLYEDDDERIGGTDLLVAGDRVVRVYGIGAMNWTWWEVE